MEVVGAGGGVRVVVVVVVCRNSYARVQLDYEYSEA